MTASGISCNLVLNVFVSTMYMYAYLVDAYVVLLSGGCVHVTSVVFMTCVLVWNVSL